MSPSLIPSGLHAQSHRLSRAGGSLRLTVRSLRLTVRPLSLLECLRGFGFQLYLGFCLPRERLNLTFFPGKLFLYKCQLGLQLLDWRFQLSS